MIQLQLIEIFLRVQWKNNNADQKGMSTRNVKQKFRRDFVSTILTNKKKYKK